jgi:hypothetical protein
VTSPADRTPGERRFLDGGEELTPGRTVADFWRWAMNDLQMNTTRGFLADYLVARAVEAQAPHRVEWDVFDVLASDGTRIEVKSSGYLQSWSPESVSKPMWMFKAIDITRIWDDELVSYVDVEPAERVDVWVFALQACDEPAAFDPTDIGQWRFWAVSNRRLLEHGTRSIGIAGLEKLAGESVQYEKLAALVARARKDNEDLARDE